MTTYERIEKVIRYMETHRAEQPGLDTLAGVAGLSPSHFHRLFSRWAGTTPKAFLKFLTSERAKELLLESRDLLDVSFESGLSGPGRLHDLLITVDGVTPGQFKARGAGLELCWGVHETPFGRALLAAAPRGVCHLSFLESSGEAQALRELRARWPKAGLRRDQSASGAYIKKLFGPGRAKVSVLLSGTPFQLRVWEALLRIPAGRAVTYGRLAEAAGVPRASRAAGTACGGNSLAFVIPCHRVLQSSGAFGGYRWGGVRKRAILGWEASRTGHIPETSSR